MRRLRLEGPGSYQGFGVAVTRKSPEVVVDDGVAEALLRSGCFRDLGRVGEPNEGGGEAAEETAASPVSEPESAEEEPGAAAEEVAEPGRKRRGRRINR